MSRNLHSTEFKEQALIKVRERGTRSVQDVANDLHTPVGTLRKWLGKSNQVKNQVNETPFQLRDDLPAQSWGPSQRLQALLETYAMSQAQRRTSCSGYFFERAIRHFFAASVPGRLKSRSAGLPDCRWSQPWTQPVFTTLKKTVLKIQRPANPRGC